MGAATGGVTRVVGVAVNGAVPGAVAGSVAGAVRVATTAVTGTAGSGKDTGRGCLHYVTQLLGTFPRDAPRSVHRPRSPSSGALC